MPLPELTRVLCGAAQAALAEELLALLQEPPATLRSALTRTLYGSVPMHVVTPAMVTAALATEAHATAPDPGPATALLERADLSAALVQHVLDRLRAALDRAASFEPGPDDTSADLRDAAGAGLGVAHLARAGHLSAPVVDELLEHWHAVGRSPEATAHVRDMLRVALVSWAPLDEAMVHRLVELGTAGRRGSFLDLVDHPQATTEVWLRLLQVSRWWTDVEQQAVWQRLAASPHLASRSPVRQEMLKLVAAPASAAAGAGLVRILMAQPHLPWTPGQWTLLLRALCRTPQPQEVARTLADTPDAVLRHIPASAWAQALHLAPRETRLVLVRTLARLGIAAPVLPDDAGTMHGPGVGRAP